MRDARKVDVVKLSDATSFSVANSPGNINKKEITFFFDDPKKTYGENIMLVTFPPNHSPIEEPMVYDEKNKRYAITTERSKDAGEKFSITTAKEVGNEENETALVLQKGFISLNDGKLQPVNKIPGIPTGNLEKWLWTEKGEIKKVDDDSKESTLQPGDRFITIYTPPGYEPKRKTPYDLQITLDGDQYLHIMQMNTIFDNLIAAKEIEPTVIVFISPHHGPPGNAAGFGVVMPTGYPLSMRLKEYSCNPEFTDKLAALTQTLRQQFHVTNDPEHRTIWGMSAGGVAAEYAALLQKIFGNVVAQSPMSWNIPVQNGKNWRDGIVYKKNQNGDDITWTTSTAELPEKEGPHNEYITAALRTGYDEISGRTINPPRPLKFYFDAGDQEREYNAEKGSLNLVKSTELFAEAAIEKGHHVIDGIVHILAEGSHHTMTWMRNIANIARSMHAPSLALDTKVALEKNSLSPSLTSQSMFTAAKQDKHETTTAEIKNEDKPKSKP